MKALLTNTLLCIATMVLLSGEMSAQDKFSTEHAHISFFSSAPISNVDARNENVRMQLDTRNGELSVDMSMGDFKFKSDKMEKDAHKKYLETGKFTKAGFRGKVGGDIDYDKPGSYNAVATGKITIHGVEKDIKQKGTITVDEKGQVRLQAEFMAALSDFNIDQPEILGKKMTEEDVKITVTATLTKARSNTTSKRKE